ncbi:Ger(x)C family spore germination protein [Paenibacillus sp. R14(2021)]|uniref:Ger(x)C family spore germination protein n=1 Tax=Paenibacillus sp. R14(2021) TaxID=2859228 RepID=UPI001C611632|nr:Ger(x)C family spore germination protein [Paenibacillus sp. R14(2021)]
MGALHRLLAAACCLLLICGGTTGCGDRAELPEKAFVMGIGFDDAGRNEVLVTFQVYKPSQTVAAKGKTGLPYINVRTRDSSVVEALRDITIHLGRKAQFSHMRVILISEKLAHKIPIPQLLDVFYRDNEPRLTSTVFITKGSASAYFEHKPFIESTISQQYYLSERSASSNSGKTVESNLLKLALQLRSQSGVGALPYLAGSPRGTGKESSAAGLSIIKGGLVVDSFLGTDTEGLLMLMKQYTNGILQVPCEAKEIKPDEEQHDRTMLNESVETLHFDEHRQVKLQGDKIKVSYKINASVAATELSCSVINTSEEEEAFGAKVSDVIKKQMLKSLVHLKHHKADLIGIGNDIYKHHPQLWKKWEKDWPEKFASIEYDIQVDTLLMTHGTTAGRTLLETKSD